jgi:hypothetical protein
VGEGHLDPRAAAAAAAAEEEGEGEACRRYRTVSGNARVQVDAVCNIGKVSKMSESGLLDQKEQRLRQKQRRQCWASERAGAKSPPLEPPYQKKMAACFHRSHSHLLRALAIPQLT